MTAYKALADVLDDLALALADAIHDAADAVRDLDDEPRSSTNAERQRRYRAKRRNARRNADRYDRNADRYADRNENVTPNTVENHGVTGPLREPPLGGVPRNEAVAVTPSVTPDRNADDRNADDVTALRLKPQYNVDGSARSNHPWKMEPLTDVERDAARRGIAEIRRDHGMRGPT